MADELNGQIFEAKNGYSGNVRENFVLPNELTVTITLNEYRELVKSNSESKLAETRHDVYRLQTENNELKQKIKVLEAMMKGNDENA